jgi:nicotinamide-nucleotide amidase
VTVSTVALVCIGDELLEGRIRDENAHWLSRQMLSRGASLTEVLTVPDTVEQIQSALTRASKLADIVITSGGLGPTEDDLTRRAVAGWLNEPLELDEDLLEVLKERFADHGIEFTDNNKNICRYPEGAEQLTTTIGTAPGFRYEAENATVMCFPGVPEEFRWFGSEYLLPRVDDSSNTSTALRFFGHGESTLADKIESIERRAESSGVDVKYCADFPIVEVFLLSSDETKLRKVQKEICTALQKWYLSQDQTLMEAVAERLLSEEHSVAAAESCTAGGLGYELTTIPGSSNWFGQSFVTYSNEAKVEMLGVEPETLEANGAVSRQTVREMAAGAQRGADADFGLSISGIAGPGGGTDEKPVGTVWFGLCNPDGDIWTRRSTFPNRGRKWIRQASIQMSIGLLFMALDNRIDEWCERQ